MLRKTLLSFCILALVPFSLAFGQGGGNGKAMTPVGNWDLEYSGEWVPPYKVLWSLNFGGTSLATAQGFPPWQPGDPIVDMIVGLTSWGSSTGHGSWKKVGRRTYINTVFTLVPRLPGEPGSVAELKGYAKAVHEFTLVDKNTLEGSCVISIVESPDPMQPPTVSFAPQQFVGKRLRPERLQAP